MIKNLQSFCVRYMLFACIAGFLGQILLPSTLYCSTGVSSATGGARLVKERLANKAPRFNSTKPMQVYVIKAGDVLSDILVNAGVSRKDALYVSRKANAVFKLRKMKPGTELELYFSPDGAGLHEIGYKVSSQKRLVLYNGRVIGLTSPATEDAPKPAKAAPKAAAVKNHLQGKNPQRTARKSHHAAQTITKRASSETLNREAPQRPLSAAENSSPTNRKAAHEPADTIRTSSSYSCGLPDAVRTSPQAPYEMLASGLVLLPPVLPMKDNNSFTSPDDKKAWMEDRDNSGKNGIRPAKNKSHLSKKKSSSMKARSRLAAKSKEPKFLKAPLTYRRVSSGFSYSRLNPFTNEARPHLGVDYSAPTGTPVHSIGSGRVNFLGWDGGYGKTIRVVHPNGYTSHYAHLSHYTRNMMVGKRVRKGEVIGYVGMTGNSTGPHLDFRITHRGTYLNPVNIECSSRKIPSKKSAGKSHRIPRG